MMQEPIAQEAVPQNEVPPRIIAHSTGRYVFWLLMMLLPVLGLILTCAWALGFTKSRSCQNLARAVLLIYLAVAIAIAILLIVFHDAIVRMLFDPFWLDEWLMPDSGYDDDSFGDSFPPFPDDFSRDALPRV